MNIKTATRFDELFLMTRLDLIRPLPLIKKVRSIASREACHTQKTLADFYLLQYTFPWKYDIWIMLLTEKKFMLTPRLLRLDIVNAVGRDSWDQFTFSSYTFFLKSAFQNDFFFGVKEFFLIILISKMDLKMNLRIITKNHARDSKIGSPLKIDFRADGTHDSHPTAWELNQIVNFLCQKFLRGPVRS